MGLVELPELMEPLPAPREELPLQAKLSVQQHLEERVVELLLQAMAPV